MPPLDKPTAAKRSAPAEPVVLPPELEADLSRRSDEARENARAGRTISGEEHIRRLRERPKQRHAG
jgi:hypothetical protein